MTTNDPQSVTPLEHWQTKIVDFGYVNPAELIANPLNFRLHPTNQQAALTGSFESLGWIDAVKVNKNTGKIIDGHLRIELAIRNKETQVPVIWLDLTEAEEAQALLMLDPIAAMAETNAVKMAELVNIAKSNTSNALVQTYLDNLKDEYELPDGEFNGEPDGGKGSDGSLLGLLSVTISNPVHVVERGEVWNVGNHVLVCAEVVTEWRLWRKFLEGDDCLFCPYPGVFVPLTLKAEKFKLIMVQPDSYVCGHILDRYAEVNGESSVRKASR